MGFGDRLSEERKRIGMNQKDFSSIAGVTKTSQVNYESGERSPNVDYIQAIATTGVDIQYILSGIRSGEIPKTINHYENSLSKSLQTQEQGNHYRVAPKSWEEFELVPFYDVEASAGAGALVDQEQIAGEMAFRRDWLKEMGLQLANCALIKARGDSMEETIHDGDLLLVDTRIDAIKDDAIYIIQTDHVLIVKRVQHALDGSLIIISDNDKYENQTISPSQVDKLKVAGRVRWYGHVL